MNIELLIEKLKLEGKITQEEIDTMVADLKAQKPVTEADLKIKQIEAQQNQTNEDLAGLMDYIITGGM